MNQDTLLPYALTTLERVKDRLFDVNSQIILSGTLTATVVLVPVTSLTGTGGLTPPGLSVGQTIYGNGIPYGTTISAIDTVGVTITLSAAPTASGGNVTLTVINQPVTFNNLLTRMINGVTDWMEKECGGRRFAQSLIVNEIYSATGARQKMVTLKQMYVNFFTTYGDMTANSNIVVNIPSTAGFQVGMILCNTANIPPAGQANFTKITAVLSSTSIQISNAALQTEAASFFQVSGLLNFQWRAGTPSNPSWTDFIPDQFELLEDGKSGNVRLYGVMPRLYNNMARLSYWCGYLVDWANAGNNVTHTLPSDLTAACENIVVRAFKRRDNAGKISEALDGATTAWDRQIDVQDTAVLGHYRMMAAIF